jgi:hypothetical protein
MMPDSGFRRNDEGEEAGVDELFPFVILTKVRIQLRGIPSSSWPDFDPAIPYRVYGRSPGLAR